MSRTKSIFAVLLLTAVVGIVPMAQAATTTVEVTIAGSSAMWQTLALGAFNEAGAGAGHWTSASNAVNLTDTRVTPNNVDPGTIWIVWNAKATKIWSFLKVDSVVGDRCYFAQPRCNVNATLSNLSGSGSAQISSVLWGADSALPANVQSLFTTGQLVSVAATDIRPEDANFAACRVNSQLGAGSIAPAGKSDGLDGLGYNSNWAPGVCATPGSAASAYVGNQIKSGYPGSTTVANVLAFNIAGSDPITGTAIPAFTVDEVGASPIVFIDERAGALATLTNATDVQLQQAFSGTNCNASAFGLAAGGINIFLREPLSGTYNTAEATDFRKPAVYPGAILGISQEANVGANNPLAGQSGTCVAGGGARYRGIGTGEEVKSVLNSSSKFPGSLDGIGYTFFSYGNVSSIANSASYGYIQLDGVDPIFASYAGGDPGEPGNGTVPGAANLPATCNHAFPCPETDIWSGGVSFPNLRSGQYKSWSVLRIVSNGTALTAAKALVTKSQAFVVTSVPDYVPFLKVKAGTITDPGLAIVRSHYQQYDGAGNLLGAAPVNSGKLEAGGDMGGYIFKSTVKTTQEVNGDGFVEVARPTNP
jgi:hypothetical protein